MRSILHYSDLLLVALLVAWVWGCGGGGAGISSPVLTGSTAYTAGGQTYAAGGTVMAPAGTTLQPLPATQIRLINQSAAVNATTLASWVVDINWQLATDFNPRWATGATLIAYSGPVDPATPTILLQDSTDDTLPGAQQAGASLWVVRNLPHTAGLLEAYLSHATINSARPDYLPGQAVEAWDYTRGSYAGGAELADFDFPSHHGLGGSYYDWQGRPAYDLLHALSYP